MLIHVLLWKKASQIIFLLVFYNVCLIDWLIDWLIDYLVFYFPLKNISLIWRRHHYRWRAEKFRPMLGAQGLWAGRNLYRATPAVTWDLAFPVTSEGPPHLVAFYDTQGDVEDLF
jgi:hypothetical protein